MNNKDKTTQIKFYLRKTYNNDIYEAFFGDKKDSEHKIRINISIGKYYIFAINFKIGGLMHSTNIRTFYVRDDDRKDKKEYKVDPKNGTELKIKNFKNENFSIIFGFDYDDIDEDIIINKFRGFIGDIFILNRKNIKSSGNSINDDEFSKLLLSFEGNYRDIITIFEDNENNIFLENNNKNQK